MCKIDNKEQQQEEVGAWTLEDVIIPAKSYKRSMKPRLPRKITSSARINLNAFWNELEEFYRRYDDRRAKNNNNDLIAATPLLPAYTTDTFDHDRESAENALNERLEAEQVLEDKKQQESNQTKILLGQQKRMRLQSLDILDDSLESEEDDCESCGSMSPGPAYWNILEAAPDCPGSSSSSSKLPSPPPPKSLVDLVSLMARRF